MAKFSNTVSDVVFATQNGITQFELRFNEASGKNFVTTDTGLRMAVSNKITSADDLNQPCSVSMFDPEDGVTEPFLMVHPTGTGGAKVVATKSFATAPVANLETQV